VSAPVILYRGQRRDGRCIVNVVTKANGTTTFEALNPRKDIRDHSPTGFEWGYGGSGPAQLALAILCHALGDDERAQRHYQDFKRRVVALIEKDEWEMPAAKVRELIDRYEGVHQ
jgi:hypothetical protein